MRLSPIGCPRSSSVESFANCWREELKQAHHVKGGKTSSVVSRPKLLVETELHSGIPQALLNCIRFFSCSLLVAKQGRWRNRVAVVGGRPGNEACDQGMPTKSQISVVDVDVTTSKTIDRVIAEIIARQERGEQVDQDQCIADHPEIAESLASFFANADLFQQALQTDTPQNSSGEDPDLTRKMHADSDTQASIGLPHAFSSGERDFGRYRIMRLLGEGGMGAVYLARDLVLKRDVAIKVPKFSAGERAQHVERFRREAMAAAKLRHRNVCPVFDVGRFEGVDFLTMAFIEGRPLSEIVASAQRLDQCKIAAAIYKLARGIQEAHSLGIVHRDLKPSNVMIDAKGEPVLMDFGLAKQINLPTQSGLTESGLLVGTPSYMSPEQIRGTGQDIGPQSDIYSLGVILFQTLTGRLPWDGSPMEVMGKKLVGDVYQPRQFRPDVDSGLEQICRRMMSKDPAGRYQSMGDVARDLRAVALRLRAETPTQPSDGREKDESDTAAGKGVDTIAESRPTDLIAPPIALSVTPPAAPPVAPPIEKDTAMRVSPPPTSQPDSDGIPLARFGRFLGRWQMPVTVSIALLAVWLVYNVAGLARNGERSIAADRTENADLTESVEQESAELASAVESTSDESQPPSDQLSEVPPVIEEAASPNPAPAASFEAQRQQVFHSMEVQNLLTPAVPVNIGDQVEIFFELANRSGNSIVIPVDEPLHVQYLPLGVGTIWIERQGAVGRIPKLDDLRRIDFCYPVGSWDTTSKSLVSSSEILRRRCEIPTEGLPAGRYNVHVEFADFQINPLSIASGTFVLASNKKVADPKFDRLKPIEIEAEPKELAGDDNDLGDNPPAKRFFEKAIGKAVRGAEAPAPKIPPKRFRPWEAAPPDTRGFSVVPNMQSLSDKLDHVAGVIGFDEPRVLATAASAARLNDGLDRSGPLLCLYGPPARATREFPLVFMIPKTDFNRLIQNLHPRSNGKLKFVTDGKHKYKCLESKKHACFSLIGEYGWLQQCAEEPGGRAEWLKSLNPFLDRMDIAFALSRRAASEGLAIQLPFSSGSYVIPDWMNEYAESVFAFSGFDVAAGGTEIDPGVGVTVAVAATIDPERDVAQWSESMTLNRDALVETLPGGDPAVVLAMSSCQQWNDWLAETANRELRRAAGGNLAVGDPVDLNSLKGASLLLSGRRDLPAERIAEQIHLQIRVENSIDAIESIKEFYDLVAPILEDHPDYRLSIKETNYRHKKALIATIKVRLDEPSHQEHLVSIWPLDDETLILQGGGLSALDSVVRQIRAGGRLTQDAALRSSFNLAAPESQHLLMVDLHNSWTLCSQLYRVADEEGHERYLGMLASISGVFSELQDVPPLLISGQFETDHVGVRVTTTEDLVAKVSKQIPLNFVALTLLKVSRGEPITFDQLALMYMSSRQSSGSENFDPRLNATIPIPTIDAGPTALGLYWFFKLLF